MKRKPKKGECKVIIADYGAFSEVNAAALYKLGFTIIWKERNREYEIIDLTPREIV